MCQAATNSALQDRLNIGGRSFRGRLACTVFHLLAQIERIWPAGPCICQPAWWQNGIWQRASHDDTTCSKSLDACPTALVQGGRASANTQTACYLMNGSTTGVMAKIVFAVQVLNHLQDLRAGWAPANVPWHKGKLKALGKALTLDLTETGIIH